MSYISIGSAASVMSTSSAQSITAAQQSGSTQRGRGRDAFGHALDSLLQSIQSGDLSAAQSAYDKLTQLAQSRSATSSSGTSTGATGASSTTSGATSSATSNASDPLGQFLSQVGTALQNGDVSALQSAASAFLASGPQASGAGGPPPPPPSSSASGGNSAAAAIGDFVSLLQSVQSGDLTDAQSSYSALSKILGLDSSNSTSASASVTTNSTSSSTSTSTSSSTSGSDASSSTDDPLKQLLTNLGSALQSGNISSAQQVLSQFLQQLPQGSLINTSA